MSGYPVDTADDNDQHSSDPNNSQSELQVTANVSDDSSVPLQEQWPYIHGSTGYIPQVYNQDRASMSMDFQQIRDLQYDVACSNSNQAEHPWSPECVDPSVLAAQELQYDASSSTMEYGYEYPPAEAQGGPSVHITAPGYNEIDYVHAHPQTGPRYAFVRPNSFGVQQGNHIGPDSNFILEVLGKQYGHREALDENTAQLLARLGASRDYGSPMGYAYDTSSFVDSDVHNAAMMENNQDTIVPARPLSVIEAQQGWVRVHQLYNTMANEPQNIVREGTSMGVNPNTVDTQSTRTSSGQLHPDGGCHHPSDAPSPTSTAASTDVTGCPDCRAVFTGKWQKVNLNRHLRQKHAGETVVRHSCEHGSCARSYHRKDARLKHYRKAHPYLSSGPPILRGSPSMTGGDQTELHHSHSGRSRSYS